MRHLASCLLAAFSLLIAARSNARAAFVFTLTQTPSSVVLDGSGTINTTALYDFGTNGSVSHINPGVAELFGGPTANTSSEFYTFGGFAGPSTLGSKYNNFTAQSGSGDVFGVDGYHRGIFVPYLYVTGTPLANHAVFAGVTFADFGFTPGTYVYTWGTGANADSLTIVGIVPEPSTWALLSFGVAGAGLVALRRRQALRI